MRFGSAISATLSVCIAVNSVLSGKETLPVGFLVGAYSAGPLF